MAAGVRRPAGQYQVSPSALIARTTLPYTAYRSPAAALNASAAAGVLRRMMSASPLSVVDSRSMLGGSMRPFCRVMTTRGRRPILPAQRRASFAVSARCASGMTVFAPYSLIMIVLLILCFRPVMRP